jgi:hypothetical protein
MSKPSHKGFELLLFLVVTWYLGAGLPNSQHPRCTEKRRINIPTRNVSCFRYYSFKDTNGVAGSQVLALFVLTPPEIRDTFDSPDVSI